MQRYRVAIKSESGISQAMRKYCDDCGISVWSFLKNTITERLQKPYDFSIAEIDAKRYGKGSDYEDFYFGISDSIIQEKLRLLKEQYGVSLNYFFVKTIAEKLTELGCSFDNREPMRKTNRKKPKAEKSDVDDLIKSFAKIRMRK